MLKVGLTGSIGSGKSLVAKIFSSLGIKVYEADTEAKKFLLDDMVKQKIASSISNDVFNTEGVIINRRLAEIVFNNPEALAILNGIIHPMVRNDFLEWLQRNHREVYILHEAAILYESGFYKDFDKVITVSAPEKLRLKRVMDRDDVGREQVLDRITNQWSDQKKVELADYVIINDGKEMVIPQVLRIHHDLCLSNGHTEFSDGQNGIT